MADCKLERSTSVKPDPVLERAICGVCGARTAWHAEWASARTDMLTHYLEEHRIPPSEVKVLTLSHQSRRTGITSPQMYPVGACP